MDLASGEAHGLPLYAVRPHETEALLARLTVPQANFLRAHNAFGRFGTVLLLPDEGGLAGAVLGLGDEPVLHGFGAAASALPAGTLWRIMPGGFDAEEAGLGFLRGSYAYGQFKPRQARTALLAPDGLSERVTQTADAICFARDLINTPPNYLGPAELADAAAALALRFGARTERVAGAALAERYPALAAVGAGSDRPAEAVAISWRGSAALDTAPLISLCGKGVCFDTGGYDLKPSAAMLRMKKDMGGAAIMLGLAQLIMARDLPVRLQLRIGCVENSVSGHAMRPSDVLRTHDGKFIEVGNTDAEGRIVLCDLLAEAAEENPDWLIDAATLTGAARVALGPDLPALFCTDDAMASMILNAGVAVHDPLWRLPLWPGYNSWLDSEVADLNTVAAKPFAGAIVAALFLQRFIKKETSWAHVDVYAWNDQARPGRPAGGEAQSLRALFTAIETYAMTFTHN